MYIENLLEPRENPLKKTEQFKKKLTLKIRILLPSTVDVPRDKPLANNRTGQQKQTKNHKTETEEESHRRCSRSIGVACGDVATIAPRMIVASANRCYIRFR